MKKYILREGRKMLVWKYHEGDGSHRLEENGVYGLRDVVEENMPAGAGSRNAMPVTPKSADAASMVADVERAIADELMKVGIAENQPKNSRAQFTLGFVVAKPMPNLEPEACSYRRLLFEAALRLVVWQQCDRKDLEGMPPNISTKAFNDLWRCANQIGKRFFKDHKDMEHAEA